MKAILLKEIKAIKKYLNNNGIKFINVTDTENIVILESNGASHYLLLNFTNVPDHYLLKHKFFKFCIVDVSTLKQAIEAIEKYRANE